MKLLFLVLSTLIFAQNNMPRDPIIQRLEEQLKNSQHMFEKMFKDDFFKDMDQQFFGGNHPFFNQKGLIEDDWERALGGLKTSWKDTKNAKVLVIEGEVSGEDPLDIQVQGGMISLKGTVNKKIKNRGDTVVRRYQFQRSYSVPRGTDIAQMKIEKKGDKELWLIFPYQEAKKKQNDDLKPLKSRESDPKI